jgi:fibronectin type 3 domain-containing protein
MNLPESPQDTGNTRENSLGLKIRKHQGDVLIKIVPRQTDAFVHFKKNGWYLERAYIREGDTSDFEQLNDEPLQPASEERWQQMAQDNQAAGAILEVLYPDKPDEQPQTFMGKLESHTELNNRHFFYLFLSADSRAVSQASGLEFRDETAESEAEYAYRAFIGGFEDSTGHSGTKIAEMQFIPEQYRAPELEGGSLDSAALLSWNHTDYDEVFVSYDLERSGNGESFRQITDVPLVYNRQTRPSDTVKGSMYHVDSLEQNGVPHQYRLIAYDYFGISSEPSNAIEVEGQNRTAPPAPKRLRAQPTSQGVEVVWEYPHSPDDLVGFYVVRSGRSLSGPFNRVHNELLAPDRMHYIDESVSTGNGRYYAVAAFDRAGNYRMSRGVSAAVRDTVPPEAPDGLEARLDSSRGLVALRWDLGEADDITGYRVFRSVNRDYEFIQVTDTPTVYNAFVDTLNLSSLDSKIFYKVVAVDDQYNHSRFSDVLEVTRPDTIAPTKALLTRAGYSQGRVNLQWEPSSSRDVLKQYLVYRSQGQEEWRILDSLQGSENQYAAPLPDTTQSWQLAIQTVDDNGLRSGLSNIQKVVVENYSAFPSMAPLQADASGDEGVTLSWDQPDQQNAYRVLIYRARGEATPLLHESIDADKTQFIDTEISPDNTYRYQVALKRKSDGVVSQRSEPVRIDLGR